MAEKIPELENLARIGKLKAEAGEPSEMEGLAVSGKARLKDAKNAMLAFESRFDLAYNAAHALSLAALRGHGYRSENRYLVFQTLQHTLKLPAAQWRVLAKAHEKRNLAEYEGHFDVDETLLGELIEVADLILARLPGPGKRVEQKRATYRVTAKKKAAKVGTNLQKKKLSS